MTGIVRRKLMTWGARGCALLSLSCVALPAQAQQSGSPRGDADGFKRHWLGLHYAHDFGSVGMSGSDVCVIQIQVTKDFTCYYHDSRERYHGEPFPGAGITDHVKVSYDRFLLSYDFAVISRFTLGARLGWAAGGNARPGASAGVNLNHLEFRAAYWFLGLEGVFRPYIHASVGTLGTIVAKAEIQAYECNRFQDVTSFNQCVSGDPAMRDQLIAESATVSDRNTVAPKLDVYQDKNGTFIGAGGGFMVAFSNSAGVLANLNLLSVASSFFIEPSLGVVLGL